MCSGDRVISSAKSSAIRLTAHFVNAQLRFSGSEDAIVNLS
ncbi:hypothetical protein ACE1CI_01640 [Aerosakkonemataceae cyanobacterium BLCC-F50]|uniref:Uncharacterized protein n=1 Tax=Floridaenema flaviceps BLCC-F50 TaxID=3153642 RepID=A0ABV4XIS8_9CYAN